MHIRKKFEDAKAKMESGVNMVYMVVAVMLPSGIELITNTQNLDQKMDYMLNTYDEKMEHKYSDDIYVYDVMFIFN